MQAIYRWIIVGGGVHGLIHAYSLLASGLAQRKDILIIDPHEKLMSAWQRYTALSQMVYLRSPVSHSASPHKEEFLRWYQHHHPNLGSLNLSFRPELASFNLFHEEWIAQNRLEDMHQVDKISAIDKDKKHYVLYGEKIYHAHNVIFALGLSQCHYPFFYYPSRYMSHVYATDSLPSDTLDKKEISILGNGACAGHLVLSYLKRAKRINWIMREPLKDSRYDFNPCFIGPKCARHFLSLNSFFDKEKILKENTYLGTLTPEVRQEIDQILIHQPDWLHIYVDTVNNVSPIQQGVKIHLSHNKDITTDYFILSTGFERQFFQPFLLDFAYRNNLALENNLYPKLNKFLAWKSALSLDESRYHKNYENIFFSGQYAQWVCGPFSNNIIGAHRCFQHIYQLFTSFPFSQFFKKMTWLKPISS